MIQCAFQLKEQWVLWPVLLFCQHDFLQDLSLKFTKTCRYNQGKYLLFYCIIDDWILFKGWLNTINVLDYYGLIQLAILMLLSLLNSAYFFLATAKFGLMQWLAFNACSLSIIAYLACFICFQITRKDLVLAIALLPQYYYGTMGLFVVSWDAANLVPQITHIIITLNVIWIIFLFWKGRNMT